MPTQSPFRSPLTFGLWLAFALALFIFVSAAASTGPGITWDEPGYIQAGFCYGYWVRHPNSNITELWEPNHEHPPAAKILYGFGAYLARGDIYPSLMTARFLATILFSVFLGMVYLFVARPFGRAAGIIATLSFVLMPRVFGHSHLAELDMPVAFACLVTTLLFAWAGPSPKRSIAPGLAWGLALLTKLNAAFLPLVLIPWAFWRYGRRAILPSVVFLVLGAVIFIGGWPWLWPDIPGRVKNYVVNKTERLGEGDRPTGTTDIPVYYLGHTYREERAPWHYPFVLTLVTVPAGILVFAGFGIREALRRKNPPDAAPAAGLTGQTIQTGRTSPANPAGPATPGAWSPAGRHAIGVLILASTLLPLIVCALPGVPKYDGVRLFMPAFPFLACLAGIGGARIWRWRGPLGRGLVTAVLIATALVLHATHPYELSYYNLLAGGAPGARKLGFETTYWGDTVNVRVVDYINQHALKGGTIGFRPNYLADFPWPDGRIPWLREDLRFVPFGQTDYLVVFPRQGYLDDTTRALIETKTPLRTWSYLDVPQCYLFQNVR